MEPPVEPYRVKSVEPIKLLSREERLTRLRKAWWNVFRLRSEDVFIDLLTDSGTGAMSSRQWAALMLGDESYAGSSSYYKFEEAVRKFTGMDFVLPTHQGRAAERILYTTLVELSQSKVVPANSHFDTGRAVLLNIGAQPIDMPVKHALDPEDEHPFKGNIDLDRLEATLKRGNVAFVLLVLTNNAVGGHPVHPENVREAARLSREHGVPLVLDICRIAENSYLVKRRDPRYAGRSVFDIVRETLSHADHAIMSAKKDGLSNIGGFIATSDSEVYEHLAARVVLEEGFITYGGLAGRDLEAIAEGLTEALDENYLYHRISQVEYLADLLEGNGVPVVKPPGGHAVYVDASRLLPHIPREQFPADSLAAHLYIESGVRAVGLGYLAFEDKEKPELLRLAIPRRTYTSSHLRWVAEGLARIAAKPYKVVGLRLVWEPKVKGVRHFLAKLAPAG
ncbi:MAG: tryptophanase [Aeropyrum sp.]|nr:tryptophanase [Aeropyrum sp.]